MKKTYRKSNLRKILIEQKSSFVYIYKTTDKKMSDLNNACALRNCNPAHVYLNLYANFHIWICSRSEIEFFFFFRRVTTYPSVWHHALPRHQGQALRG